MATEQITNGNFAPHQQNYGSTEKDGVSSQSSSGGSDIPKDEVGWYFVEQYYTTLSRSPEKLFLFYNKRSQFVSGTEEEKVAVCIGQKTINERIKELEFQDCKVRITNVDSQGSDQHIVIQVIGEISNKQQPHKKFVQTFVLAAQTNGYFVLNDIFRYISDEDAEVEAEDASHAEAAGTTEAVSTANDTPAESLSNNDEATAHKLDEDDEQASATDANAEPEVSAPPAAVNGTAAPDNAEIDVAEDAPVAAAVTSTEEKPSEEAAAAAVEEEEDVTQPEKPKDPEPTPVQPKATPAPAPTPAKPAVPKSWASLAAAANRVAMPQMPGAASGSTSAASKSTAASAPQPAANTAPPSAPSAPAAAQVQRDPSPATSGADSAAGWQTAGADHSKRQSRSIGQPQAEEQTTRAYIKNVFEGVKDDELKAALQKHGEITYLDISRGKNCAFVDFATRAGFQSAVAANPHKIGEDSVFVEERRVRAAQGNFGNSFPRGGAQRGGRGDARPAGQGRGGFKQDGGRGGFNPRGRGGTSTPRGRGNSQAA
ncbi:hypothetical protein EJ05DRAFT_64159 [Pseudovirgaria hyperparasitica]|uniref:NTF2-domain-containing protein n=1 Tax=Pseudovirgaria hyperparasitica TaxID=470096 RepID=A0A6A6W4A4_9PEZI|nr:uncharacterized protein EJ05DRAFT_64159 [Pseudovirgaria hyperparasitica]KAF2756397.1 hypothetical protein EJ05DRAFT_64159 [Pseudovirgaria hyperparasitica]